MNKITSILLFSLVAGLMGWADPARATAIKICVDCPVGAPNFPITAGHAFVQMIPMNNAQVGNPNLVYRFYPAGKNVFGGAGKIRNDKNRPWDMCITYQLIAPA